MDDVKLYLQSDEARKHFSELKEVYGNAIPEPILAEGPDSKVLTCRDVPDGSFPAIGRKRRNNKRYAVSKRTSTRRKMSKISKRNNRK